MATSLSLLVLCGIILPSFLSVAVDAKCCRPNKYSARVVNTEYRNSDDSVIRVEHDFYYHGGRQRAALVALDGSYKLLCNLNTERCSRYVFSRYSCRRYIPYLEGVNVRTLIPSGCVEDVLNHVGNYTIGLSPNSFTVNEYSGYMDDKHMSILVGANCVPLMANTWAWRNGNSGLSTVVWSNVRVNEVPWDAFSLPSSCPRFD